MDRLPLTICKGPMPCSSPVIRFRQVSALGIVSHQNDPIVGRVLAGAHGPDLASPPHAMQNLIEDFNCALQKKILLQGHMYLFDRYVCFYSNIFGFEKKVRF